MMITDSFQKITKSYKSKAFGNHGNIALQVTTIKPCIPVDINIHKQYQWSTHEIPINQVFTNILVVAIADL